MLQPLPPQASREKEDESRPSYYIRIGYFYFVKMSGALLAEAFSAHIAGGKPDIAREAGDKLVKRAAELDEEAERAIAIYKETKAKAKETKAKAKETKAKAEKEYKLAKAKAQEAKAKAKEAKETKAKAEKEYDLIMDMVDKECEEAEKIKDLTQTRAKGAKEDALAAGQVYIRYRIWLDERIALTRFASTRCGMYPF